MTGIFDNLRKLPEPHPVEEILGLSPIQPPPTPPTPPTAATPRTPRTARTPPFSSPVAPERDYSKVANSIVRQVVAGGYFTGKSKQLYDFLYSRTRGAIVPVRSVRITKPRLMKGSGIGSERTLLKNMHYLEAIGLLKVDVTDGAHGGNEYTVFLPEEAQLPDERTPPTPPTPPTADDVRHPPQEVGYVPPVESGVGGVGSKAIESTTSDASKTSSLRQDQFDDEAFAKSLREVEKELTGKASSAQVWEQLFELLVTELKIAAGRTTVSNVPAFLTEHLRRRLWKVDKKRATEIAVEPEQGIAGALTDEERKKCPDCSGTNFWYPDGLEKGVARCTHQRLRAQT
jgi:hypothetical protein